MVTETFPITPQQYVILSRDEAAVAQAQSRLQHSWENVLAGHGLTSGHVVGVTATTITVELPDDGDGD